MPQFRRCVIERYSINNTNVRIEIIAVEVTMSNEN